MYSGLLTTIEKKNIVPLKELRPYIWKDELGEKFILTKGAEIYLFDDNTVGVYLYRNKVALLRKVRLKCPILHEIDQHGSLCQFHTKIENVPLLIKLTGAIKRKFCRSGKSLRDISDKLGHKIIWTGSVKDN